uniref:DUF1279 domain-containing protein n=2 Tax=Schistocephalus solidus TaxID=70667 RepID=A0A0X3Q4J7_SCHSO
MGQLEYAGFFCVLQTTLLPNLNIFLHFSGTGVRKNRFPLYVPKFLIPVIMSVIAKSSLRSLISIRSTFSGGLILKARALTSSFFLAQGQKNPTLNAYPSFYQPSFIPRRCIVNSTSEDKPNSPQEQKNQDAPSAEKPTLVQRFKQAYKVYGKVLIVVHGITSAAWLGAFYCVALTGFNAGALLESLQAPDWMLRPFRLAGGAVGTWASAYLIYKVFTPLRYFCTLWLTRTIVHYLRAKGRIPPLAEKDRLRNLAREGTALTRSRLNGRFRASRQRAVNSLRNLSPVKHRK